MAKYACSPEKRREFTEANRIAWDQVAPYHASENQQTLLEGFSRPGFNTLADHCLEPLKAIGVAGKSIAQLCCNNGCELLSLKGLGAGHCIGFDGSSEFIQQAHELKSASGYTDVEFLTTDIYDIPRNKRGPYDIVMSTVGVISWMPDLETLFNVYGRLTRPDGHVFIEEMHPVLMMYEQAEDQQSSYLKYSYFNQQPFVEESSLDYYGGAQYRSSPHYSFQHTLAEIIMAAISQGFELRQFVELGFNISEFCANLENVPAVPPMGMTMVWQKTV